MNTEEHIKNQLIEELRLAGLPKEKIEEILARLSDQVMQRVAILILGALPPERHAQYKLMQARGEEALRLFLHSHIPNLETRIRQEVKATVAELKGLMAHM